MTVTAQVLANGVLTLSGANLTTIGGDIASPYGLTWS